MLFDPIYIKERVQEILDFEVSLDESQKLATYAELLLKWNATYNLTSIENPNDVIDLHLIDSLSLVKFAAKWLEGEKEVLDIGSGGGLPGIPLAIVKPSLDVTLIDAVQKKTIFQRQAIAMCKINNAMAVHGRIEKMKDKNFDVITCRAFSSLKEMIVLSRHLLKDNGVWIAMKGRMPTEEISDLPKDIELVDLIKVSAVEEKMQRHLIILKMNESKVC